jgi:hypothetical protein
MIGRSEIMAKTKTMPTREEAITFEYSERTFIEVFEDGLRLRELTPNEVKERLNIIPGKIAYWKALSADIEMELNQSQEVFDAWYAEKYLKLAEVKGLTTEGAKKNKIILDNQQAYMSKKGVLNSLSAAKAKAEAIARGYDTMRWTLVAISGLVARELSSSFGLPDSDEGTLGG